MSAERRQSPKKSRVRDIFEGADVLDSNYGKSAFSRAGDK